SYPGAVVKAYAYYKSVRALEMWGGALAFDVSSAGLVVVLLALLQCTVFGACFALHRGSAREMIAAVWPVPVLFVFSLLPLCVAFPILWGSADNVLLFFATGVTIVGLAGLRTIDRRRAEPTDSWRVPIVRAGGWIRTAVAATLVACLGLTWVGYEHF